MIAAAILILALFVGIVCSFALRHADKLFVPRHGRKHRVAGAAYVCWLALGVVGLFRDDVAASRTRAAAYDVVLALLGTVATFSAAHDFGGRRLTSKVSGVLDDKSLVTRSEMLEHGFYQLLNLAQILGLYAQSTCTRGPRGIFLFKRRRGTARGWLPFFLLGFQTAPWLYRKAFPVNSFSANYTGDNDPWLFINVMYRIKKYQYVFYKNALLHGLNITTCLSSTPPRIQGRRFRTYWLCLNAAYTHEFFLQTLVKRRLLEQRSMLRLNGLLMVGSSLAAVEVLRHHVDWRIAAASLVFNFANRKHDVANTLCIAVAFSVWGHDRLHA